MKFVISICIILLKYLEEQESEGGESDDPVFRKGPVVVWFPVADKTPDIGVFAEEISDNCRSVEQVFAVDI